jgi:hypothetical protein
LKKKNYTLLMTAQKDDDWIEGWPFGKSAHIRLFTSIKTVKTPVFLKTLSCLQVFTAIPELGLLSHSPNERTKMHQKHYKQQNQILSMRHSLRMY